MKLSSKTCSVCEQPENKLNFIKLLDDNSYHFVCDKCLEHDSKFEKHQKNGGWYGKNKEGD